MVKIEDNDCGDENEDFDWSSEDDREIESYTSAPNSRLMVPVMGSSTAEASSSDSFRVDFFHRFIDMGYSDKLVEKVIEENGDKTFEQILDMLCTYSTLESFPEGNSDVDSDFWSSDDNDNKLDSDSCWSGNEGNGSALSINDETISRLVDMGYTAEEAAIAVDRCGSEASVFVLTDFIFAAQKSKVQDSFYPEEEKPRRNLFCEMGSKKRKLIEKDLKQKKHRDLFENELIRLPKPMIGFGVPTVSSPPYRRTLPEVAIAEPYFYYENVALAPKGVWDTKKSFLYDVEPEFVDSKFFSAANRKRGYIHNLPLDNRRPVLPLAAQTIQEALPMTERWWPTWDTRNKLNCLQTCIASARLTNSIRNLLEAWDGLPPLHVQKKILKECKKWNLVWVGKNKVAPLECDEIEMLLGFPKNHTRGGGISRTDRYKSLGNSFQVDTVAYHLSPLKDEFPQGINVLSLFSGIGGAEVALHRLGIKLNTVVSVEKSAVNRNIVRDFWEQTNQTGNLIDFDDVQKVTKDKLEQIMKRYGEFNLVIGGSPCNNLAGSNRHHRDGLKGKESSLFFEYHRILDVVRCWVKISRGGLC